MATQVWRSNPGETAEQVTTAVGAATTKLVEITVDLNATGVKGPPDRKINWTEVRDCVNRIMDSMQKNNPAVF
jgi:hypothetical protein